MTMSGRPISEITVTPEMFAATTEPLGGIGWAFLTEEALAVIYRAMHAVAPVELVSAGELAAVRDRDEWERAYHRCSKAFHDLSCEMDAKVAAIHLQLTARITEIDTLLARRPVPEIAKVEHNPFRQPPVDPRRIGSVKGDITG